MTTASGVRSVLTVPARFSGPIGTASGGWVAGTLAGELTGRDGSAVEVTLRRPIPLETEITLDHVGDTAVLSLDGRRLAEAVPVSGQLTPPPFVPYADAARAEEGFAGFARPGVVAQCFACGLRPPGDGLRIFPGPVPGSPGLVAAGWRVPANVVDAGVVPEPIIWSALDCVTAWAHAGESFPVTTGPALLGRLTGQIFGRVYPLGGYSVVARATGRDGRKLFGESAVYEADGSLVAAARAVWILPAEA